MPRAGYRRPRRAISVYPSRHRHGAPQPPPSAHASARRLQGDHRSPFLTKGKDLFTLQRKSKALWISERERFISVEMEDRTQYLVRYADEMRDVGVGPSSYIPTFGAAASAIDQYRTVAVASTNLPELGAAFTDIQAVAALAKVAEGGIADISDLEAAETALQALLLHDIVHVLIPTPKVDYGNGLVSYIRHDENQRTQFGFDLFAVAKSRDWLVAPEFIRATDGVVRSSTIPESALVGKTLEGIRAARSYRNEYVAEAINVAAESHGIPAYFADPTLVHSRRGDGFSKRFYHRMRLSWDKAVHDIPPVVCTFSLPPLLAIVLHRLNNRADLKSVISELRAELASVRNELRTFNNIVTQSTSNAEIEARVRYITESFDAIVPESRLSMAQRRQRRILSIQRLARPLIKFAMGFAMRNGATIDDGYKVADNMSGLVIESDAIVDRTITAQTFVGLLSTDTLQSLVEHHLSPTEVAGIERSIRQRK
jgi:hypothetical protein